MLATQDAGLIRVSTASDLTSAELVLAPNFPTLMLTEELCINLLRDAQVEITEFSRQAIQRLINEAHQGTLKPGAIRVANAQPPVHGQDGRVEWVLEKGHDADTSHYDRSAFITVKPGEVVARITAPTPEADGRNVLGQTIPAKPGRPIRLDLDDAFLCDAQGQVIALCEGVLERHDFKLRIRKVIEVADYVDFSTGNIDFDGDVVINKGVRDCFSVKARGNVKVQGLIEAACIECTGDLDAAGGFAGREQGRALVGGNMHAKYLDNIKAEVQGDLEVDREIVNSILQVDGQVIAPHGAIIGGKMTAVGKIDVGMLGSQAGVATEVILGQVPKLEAFRRRLQPFIDELGRRREKLLVEQKTLNTAGRRATATDKERQTEILFELSQVNHQWTRALMAADALDQRIAQKRTVNLVISRKLHAGVQLTIGRQRFIMAREMRGPVHILLDTKGGVMYKQGENPPAPLAQVAQIKAA
jgi:uncharacterized protein (DUF342 family)